MKKRSVVLASAWAVGTFGLVMAAGLPSNLDAIDQPRVISTIAKPVLKSAGLEYSVEVVGMPDPQGNWCPAADSKLNLIVHVTNTTANAASGDFGLSALQAAVPNPLGRTMTLYQPFWKTGGSITLNPGQSDVVQFTTDPVPGKRMLQVELDVSGQKMAMNSFAPSPSTRPSGGS